MRKTVPTLLLCSLVLVLACTAGAAAATRADLAKESTLEQVLQRGVLKVGFSTFVPWAMQDKKGDYIGFEIDVARRLAQDMGVKAQFEPTQWSGIIPALLSGKFDVIIGGMSIQPQRGLKVNFTIPYEYSGMSLVASRKLAGRLRSLADFNGPGVILAIRQGTTAVDAARKHLPKAQVKYFDNEAQTIQEVLNGRAHAVVASEPFPAFQALKHPDKLFLPVKKPFTSEPIAFAVRKGDPDFVNFLDGWIRVVTDEGWLEERHSYWFRTDAWQGMVE
ncbi:MAG: transporter substrate-binding domain-containing protein [Proteobacteria bacterium]|nr:transporter substrate-binding domain-containing protein [Pseudomonadota bacterium]MBU1595762.1 transporter substrate-binding domain-containing protein [Pseudomonadota bacterium]